MSEHAFTLVITGDLECEKTIDALFEAGCDDATFGTVDHVGYGDFVRRAPTFAEAVHSAIEQVESVAGLTVLRIEPDDLVTMNEIAERMGRSQRRAGPPTGVAGRARERAAPPSSVVRRSRGRAAVPSAMTQHSLSSGRRRRLTAPS